MNLFLPLIQQTQGAGLIDPLSNPHLFNHKVDHPPLPQVAKFTFFLVTIYYLLTDSPPTSFLVKLCCHNFVCTISNGMFDELQQYETDH